MYGSLNKSWRSVFAFALILSVLLTLPPFSALLIHYWDDANATESDELNFQATLAAAESAVGSGYVIPRASHEPVFASLKHLPCAIISGRDVLALGHEARHFSELIHYVLENDVHFNIPLITFRQPYSEHASEG